MLNIRVFRVYLNIVCRLFQCVSSKNCSGYSEKKIIEGNFRKHSWRKSTRLCKSRAFDWGGLVFYYYFFFSYTYFFLLITISRRLYTREHFPDKNKIFSRGVCRAIARNTATASAVFLKLLFFFFFLYSILFYRYLT